MSVQGTRFQPQSNDSKRMLELLEQSMSMGTPSVKREMDYMASKKPSKSPYIEVEKALLIWHEIQSQNNIRPTTFELRQEALKISRALGKKEFGASNGWLYNWRQKYLKTAPKIETKTEETESIQTTVFNDHRPTEKPVSLVDIFKNYTCENLFVADECILYYKRLPKSGFRDFAGKLELNSTSNDKILVLLCCNLQGDEKLKPFIVGPNIDYKVFKKHEGMPCKFVKKDSISLNLTMFYDWLAEFNNYCRGKDRKIAMFIRPTEEHQTTYTFSHVQVVFYPFEGSRDLHPMQNGILMNFKCHLRKMLCEKYKLFYSFGNADIIAQFSEPLNILDVIFSVKVAWESVDKEVVFDAYKALFQLHTQGLSFGKFSSEFIAEMEGIDSEATENRFNHVWPIKAYLEMTKQDVYWALTLLKNAVIQLGLPIYKDYLVLEGQMLGKDLKFQKPNDRIETWYLSEAD